MAVSDKARWRDWADGLRQEMMSSLTPEVTKSVEVVTSETGTVKAESTVRSTRFWQAVKTGNRPNEFLVAAGFDIDFEADEKIVREVTFRLNETWMKILQPVLDRANES